jgi:phosphonate transport system permease protein
VLVAAFGLGVFPAVVALVVGSVGMFGKFFADAMEEVDPRVLESVRASGGSYAQVLRYAVIPQIMPTLIANTVFRFEINIRAATVLGGIAGQGIGYELYRSISQLEYGRAGAAIFTVAVLVFVAERLSDLARRQVAIAGGLQ